MQQLTDQELRNADQQTRTYWLRVYLLMNESACTLEQAIKAVQAADEASL